MKTFNGVLSFHFPFIALFFLFASPDSHSMGRNRVTELDQETSKTMIAGPWQSGHLQEVDGYPSAMTKPITVLTFNLNWTYSLAEIDNLNGKWLTPKVIESGNYELQTPLNDGAADLIATCRLSPFLEKEPYSLVINLWHGRHSGVRVLEAPGLSQGSTLFFQN